MKASRSQENVLLAIGIPYEQAERMSFDKAWQIIADHRRKRKEFLESKRKFGEEVNKYADNEKQFTS